MTVSQASSTKAAASKAEKVEKPVEPAAKLPPLPIKQTKAKSQHDGAKADDTLGYLLIIVILAGATRFWIIDHPAECVFDEVHFGKFANGYLTGKYYFDIHPPLGKLVLGAMGWSQGYPGDYPFENIGDKFSNHTGSTPVPYVAMRSAPAFFNFMACTFGFLALREFGVSNLSAFFGALLVVFDVALNVQSRLILIDSFLFFFVVLTFYCDMKLTNIVLDKRNDFTPKYWLFVVLTAISMGCTMSVKWTGLATAACCGLHHVAVSLYRIRTRTKDEKLKSVWKETGARIALLAVLPFIVYIFIFYLHFKYLPYGGEGDGFHTTEFRATLEGSLNEEELAIAKELKPITFLGKVWELNKVMFETNKGILEPHPWQSKWYTWPITMRGIDYWGAPEYDGPEEEDPLQKKIYLLGNPAVWWLTAACMGIYAVVLVVVSFFQVPFKPSTQRYLVNGCLLLVHWLTNLLPYIPIERSTFLYHYFPSLFCAIIVTALTIDYLLPWPKIRFGVILVLLSIVITGWSYWAPWIYGLPVSNDEIAERQWYEGWK